MGGGGGGGAHVSSLAFLTSVKHKPDFVKEKECGMTEREEGGGGGGGCCSEER